VEAIKLMPGANLLPTIQGLSTKVALSAPAEIEQTMTPNVVLSPPSFSPVSAAAETM
jgi:hypothetical protein